MRFFIILAGFRRVIGEKLFLLRSVRRVCACVCVLKCLALRSSVLLLLLLAALSHHIRLYCFLSFLVCLFLTPGMYFTMPCSSPLFFFFFIFSVVDIIFFFYFCAFSLFLFYTFYFVSPVYQHYVSITLCLFFPVSSFSSFHNEHLNYSKAKSLLVSFKFLFSKICFFSPSLSLFRGSFH